MSLHTIVALDDIFYQPATATQTQALGANRWVAVTEGAQGRQLARLISTNPRDYLNKRYRPGARF